MRETAKCIGGMSDGKTVTYASGYLKIMVEAYIPSNVVSFGTGHRMQEVVEETYYRYSFASDTREEVVVLVHEDISPTDLVRRLISQYKAGT